MRNFQYYEVLIHDILQMINKVLDIDTELREA